jgi:hypothetical protein
MTVKLPTVAAVVPINKPPVHIISENLDGTYALTNSDSGHSRIVCGDINSAQKEKFRLDALSAQEKF